MPLWMFAQCPAITGIMVNSCGGNGTEGQDEYFTFKNGSNPLNINSLIVTFPAGGTFCNTTCGGNNWQQSNPSTQAVVNNLTASCPGLLVEPPGGIIPAGAWVLAFVGSNPNFSYNFCGSCNTGPIYVLFTTSVSNVGKFSNTMPRTLIVNFGGGCIDSAFYDPANFVPANTDGNYVMYDPNTGMTSYTTQSCPSCIPLPVLLEYFTASSRPEGVLLQWSLDWQDALPGRIELQRSRDGIHYELVSVFEPSESARHTQTFMDKQVGSHIYYYQLKLIQNQGEVQYSERKKVSHIVLQNNESLKFSLMPNPADQTLRIEYRLTEDFSDKTGTIEIYDMQGRVLYVETLKTTSYAGEILISVDALAAGVYRVYCKIGETSVSNPLVILR